MPTRSVWFDLRDGFWRRNQVPTLVDLSFSPQGTRCQLSEVIVGTIISVTSRHQWNTLSFSVIETANSLIDFKWFSVIQDHRIRTAHRYASLGLQVISSTRMTRELLIGAVHLAGEFLHLVLARWSQGYTVETSQTFRCRRCGKYPMALRCLGFRGGVAPPPPNLVELDSFPEVLRDFWQFK